MGAEGRLKVMERASCVCCCEKESGQCAVYIVLYSEVYGRARKRGSFSPILVALLLRRRLEGSLGLWRERETLHMNDG